MIPAPEPGNPAFMADLGDWNYLIGFGAIMVGLALSAHPSTPLGRGRGVVIGMLACFLIGLLWICTFYVFSNDIDKLPVFDDLGQFNLVVGIALHGRRLHLRHPLGVSAPSRRQLHRADPGRAGASYRHDPGAGAEFAAC